MAKNLRRRWSYIVVLDSVAGDFISGSSQDYPWFIPHSSDGYGWQTDFADRFLYYGTGGLYDPKNYTIEPWLLGGGTVGTTRAAWVRPTLAGFGRGFLLSQTIAFAGIGVVGAIFDPLDHTEGGLDEYIGSLHDTKRNVESSLDWWSNVYHTNWPF